MGLEVPPNATMRDIHDLCTSNGLPSLAQGMIELPPPKALRATLGDAAMEDSVHQYMPRWGDTHFREAMVKTLKAQGEQVEVENVLTTQGVTGGVVAGLLLVHEAAKAEGRQAKVALLEPFYTYHKLQVSKVTGAEAVYIPCKPDLSPDVDALEQAVAAGLDGAIVCNPCNPSGRQWRKDELERLCKLGITLIFDEVYSEMVFAGPHVSVTDGLLSDKTIVCRGFSKNVGAQSWRVGYTISTAATIQKLMPAMDPLYICSPLTQRALAMFLDKDAEGYREHMVLVNEMLRANWRDLSAAFQKRFGWTPVEPEGTMYGCFWHHGTSDMEETTKCLHEANVGVCPGNIFMRPDAQSGFIRIHCGVSREKCADVVKRLTA